VNVSQALELLAFDENDRDIVVDKILNENWSVKKIRNCKQDADIKHFNNAITNDTINEFHTFEKPTKDDKEETKSIDPESNIINISDKYKELNHQKIILLKKVKLCLKISLSRMDDLIHEYDDINSEYDDNIKSKDNIKDDLLKNRITLHSLLDDNLKLISKFKNLIP